MMIEGLCAAFQATGTGAYLQSARTAADFVLGRMSKPGGGVFRVWRDGTARIGGFLDDHAVMSNALIDLYESCFDRRYLERAVQLIDYVLQHFWDGDGLYLTAADGERLVHRPRAPFDGAWPSGTSTCAFALVRLQQLTGREIFRERAEQVFASLGEAAQRNAFGFAHLLAAAEFPWHAPLSIVFAGKAHDSTEADALNGAVHRLYPPARTLALAQDVPSGAQRGTVQGRAAAYVCRGNTCRTPATTAEVLRDQLIA
jgi:uncharacterized protein YyaL (SSP411 family)